MEDIKFIYFDLGSTLIDEGDAYRSRIQKTIAGSGISFEAFSTMLCHERYRDIVVRLGLEKIPFEFELEKLYDETIPLLQSLIGYPLGIIANQPAQLKEKLKRFGILEYFDIILGSDDIGLNKPDPKIFELAIQRAGVPCNTILMVGDRLDNDIYPAKKAGMMAAWIRQGFDKDQTPCDVTIDYIFDSVGDILKVI